LQIANENFSFYFRLIKKLKKNVTQPKMVCLAFLLFFNRYIIVSTFIQENETSRSFLANNSIQVKPNTVGAA
jgi:hypothetical protein